MRAIGSRAGWDEGRQITKEKPRRSTGAEVDRVLVRRGGKFVLIDLDEESGRGGNAVGLAIIWTLMVLIGVAVMWRAGAL